MSRDCQELPIFPYDGELDQRLGEEKNGQIVESTPSRPRRYHLARIADAGSVPCSATTYKGSEILRALFLVRNPRAMRGSGHLCCGWPSAETPEIGHLLCQSRLYSPFGLRVGAVLALAKSSTYARRFIVNQGHRSGIKRATLVQWELISYHLVHELPDQRTPAGRWRQPLR